MLNFKDFNAIENKYPTNKILFKGICIWSYLRIYAYDKAYTGSGTAQNASSISKNTLLKSLLWQLPKLGKFETLVLSSSDQRKWIDNLWYDRFDFHPEIKNKALVLEIPSPQHKPHGLTASKNVYSKIWWYAIELVISKTLAKPIIQGEKILKDLLNELIVEIDVDGLLKKFWAQYLFSKWAFSFYKTKQLFLITPYTNFARVLAAKHLNIKVIEFQHGLISAKHNAYCPENLNEKQFLPDRILTFGKNEVKILQETQYGNSESIVPIGSFYIDWLNRNQSIKNSASEKIKCCFTAQDVHIEPTINFLNKLVTEMPNIEFTFIPRKLPIEAYYQKGLDSKIVANNKLDTYQTMVQSDFHFTVYSTCATESLALGTPSILINIEGLAETHFGVLAKENPFLEIIETAEHAIKAIETFKNYKEEEVKQSISFYFAPNFKENLTKAITFD